MFIGDYSYEDDIRVQRQEAFEQGSKQKSLESAAIMINKFNISIDDVCLELNLSKEEVTEFLKNK